MLNKARSPIVSLRACLAGVAISGFCRKRVITMKEYKELPRLKASEKTGIRHISVTHHTSLNYPQHWHDYFEIEVVLRGTGTHFYNGTAYTLEEGDIYLLTPVDFHGIEADKPIELLNISFDTVWLSEEMRSILYAPELVKLRRPGKEAYQQFVAAAQLLQNECETNGPCIRQLLEYLLSRFVPLDQTQPEAKREQLSGIRNAVAYMEQHFREKITLEMLSRQSGYHPTYFSNLFCRVTGQTYIQRLTSLRINYAKMLLRKGVSVSEACFASGFGSLSNFSAVFRKICGTSPGEYRNSRQEKACNSQTHGV